MIFFSFNSLSIYCINSAAIEYQIPAKLLISILNMEGGKIGLAKRNKNGTYDLGPSQINTTWWPTLYHYGISQKAVLYNPCINIKVAAWILSKAIANSPDLITGIGRYHSYTDTLNHAYVLQVSSNYKKLNQILWS